MCPGGAAIYMSRVIQSLKFWRIYWFSLYVLQLENYELWRYLKVVYHQFKTAQFLLPPPPPWRKTIVWTAKFTAIFALTVVIGFVSVGLAVHFSSLLWFLVVVCTFFLFPFVAITISVAILKPVDFVIKKIVVWRAKNHLAKFPNVKIIGIAGSYGKTTVKEFIASVLKEKFEVLVTPENINTPLGISRLLLKSLNDKTQWLVVEMGEYYRGDVKEICKLTPPDISVVTGVNEAHLERLHTLANTLMTIFEVVQHAKPEALAILNADDTSINSHFKTFVGSHPVTWYSAKDNERGEYPTKLLAHYAQGSAMAAVCIGRRLGLTNEQILHGVANVEPISHRLQPIESKGGVLVIDDSYNGNPAGVHEAVQVLKKYQDRRRIFITPGLVEMGKQSESVHVSIGKELAHAANLVILIKNSVTPSIAAGLTMEGFAKENIIWFNTAPEAHAGLKDILKSGDVILFQNDWGDNYL